MRFTRLVLAAVVVGITLFSQVASGSASAETCRYVLGFKAVYDAIPDVIGSCLVDEHYNPDNGDALQETANGLMVWRKADNFTAFTDGYRSWVNGPFGIQQRLNSERFAWELDAASTVQVSGPAPAPAPAPKPAATQPNTTAPSGATAICKDGTYSFSQNRRGTCSHHGGVAQWLGNY
ncbi:MAG: DUF3761 domain-containing protein [Chloroflexi bacterium]|nr:DUF3761 domain-containing protein [Chloroflexota bacterium]